MPRILRLSLRSFWSSSVSPEPSSTSEPASGTTLNAIGATYFSGAGKSSAPPSCTSCSTPSITARAWLGQLLDAGQPAARHRLIGRDDQPDQPGLVVQHLEHRHRGHGGAVRVGDDALRPVAPHRLSKLTSDTTSGTSGSLRHADELSITVTPGGGEPRRLHPRHRRAGGEQRDVQAGRVGGLGVLDLDLLAAERQLLALRARGGEEPHLVAGKSRSSSSARITWPTWPVAPTTPIESPIAHRPVPAYTDGLFVAAEAERLVQRDDGLVQFRVLDQHRDPDLGGGDQVDVDADLGQRLAERGGDARDGCACPRRSATPCRCGRRKAPG